MSIHRQPSSLCYRLRCLALLCLLPALISACQGAPATVTAVPTVPPPVTVAVPSPQVIPPSATATAVPATVTLTARPPTATLVPATATLPPLTATPGPAPQIAVLAYHHFGVPAAGDYDCPLDKFEDHLHWLKAHGYESVLPQQLVDAIAGRATLPPHPVMFTFDDNNGEQYTDAAPLLEQYGYHGAFFVMTVTIGKRYYMKADQLRDLERRGHVIGGHTWDHRDMAILTPKELQFQLDQSEADLNEVLGHKPLFLSYPFGAYTEDVAAEVEKRGYAGAFRLRDANDPQVAPQFMIHRQIIPGVWSIEQFAASVHSMEPESEPEPSLTP